jgi:hypothetical protein
MIIRILRKFILLDRELLAAMHRIDCRSKEKFITKIILASKKEVQTGLKVIRLKKLVLVLTV